MCIHCQAIRPEVKEIICYLLDSKCCIESCGIEFRVYCADCKDKLKGGNYDERSTYVN